MISKTEPPIPMNRNHTESAMPESEDINKSDGSVQERSPDMIA